MFSQMESEWFDQEIEAELVSPTTAARRSGRSVRKAGGLVRAAFVALLLVGVAIVLLGAKPAHAEEVEGRKIGIGYKIGNGVGFVGGDVVLRLIPHAVLDLQANYASVDGMTGYGLAPTLQLQWKEIGHTPYLGGGLQYVNMSDATRAGSVTGFVINGGYEWRFASGVGVLVGGGVQSHGPVHATRGTVINNNGGTTVNLEAGVRYFF